MATTQAASSTAVAVGGGTVAPIRETIVGSHILKIDGSSATKDLGVGNSIKSSTFNVGGHDWYIECYPYGEDEEENGGWVSLFLCLHVHNEQVEAGCKFSMIEDTGSEHPNAEYRRSPLFEKSIDSKHTFNADTLWRCGSTRIFKRKELESLLEDSCFEVSCDVYVVKEFAAMPPPDLHRPLASGMPGDLTFQVSGELFRVHRGLPAGPSAHVVTASPTSTGASSSTVAGISSGSHVLTIDGYSKTKEVFFPNDFVVSEDFVVGGRRWNIHLCPSLKQWDRDKLLVFLYVKDQPDEGPEVLKVRLEFTLLSFAREIISSAQFCYAFTRGTDSCPCEFPFNTETEPLLGDGFHVKCDVSIVKEIPAVRPPDLHRHFGNLLASQVGTDVTFEVGGELLSAHKLVLATRSTAFMAEFFGPAAGKKAGASGTTVTRVRIVDMEARVFKALLHFIYTDTLPEVREDDDGRIVMAQGLLAAADRYAMERLKLICADMLCSYVNDARAAVDTLELADKYGCRRLKEACMRLLKDHFAKVAGSPRSLVPDAWGLPWK